MTYKPPAKGVVKVNSIDPQRITDRLFGGPHWKIMLKIEDTDRLVDPETGDVYLGSMINLGWKEGFNVYPFLMGPGRKLKIESNSD